ncbi:MAG TPA: CHAP domain-containing protein [Streptosporangiaceae bacterium]|nr:CHAP domain-containing protein [Streptosporangiaceae bacterium]
MNLRKYLPRLAALAVIPAALAALGLAPASAATTITVTGVVHCHGGATEGVWVVSSGGGSGWASVHSFKTGKNDGSSPDVRYGRTFATNLPTTVSFHVGCSGSTASWKTVNYSPGFKVSGSRTLNLFCGNGNTTGPCNFPATGKVNTIPIPGHNPPLNLGDPGQCTEGALLWMHAYDGLWGGWSGNAAQWTSTAAAKGWSVTTIPMPDSIVVFPGTASNSAGHVAWVVSLDTNAAGDVTGLYVHEENYDGTATKGTGHTRFHHYPLSSAYHYIIAPAPH